MLRGAVFLVGLAITFGVQLVARWFDRPAGQRHDRLSTFATDAR